MHLGLAGLGGTRGYRRNLTDTPADPEMFRQAEYLPTESRPFPTPPPPAPNAILPTAVVGPRSVYPLIDGNFLR